MKRNSNETLDTVGRKLVRTQRARKTRTRAQLRTELQQQLAEAGC